MRANGVTKSQAILVSSHVGRLVLFVAIAGLLGRRLAPADFGFVALIASFFAVAMEILDMGTTAVATREIAAEPAQERETLEALLALRRLIALLLATAAIGLAMSGYVVHGEQRVVLVAAALAFYLLHLHGYQVVFQVRQAYGRPTALGLGGQVGFLAASLAALKLHAGGIAIALLVVAREIVLVAGICWIAIRMLGARLRPAWLHRGIGPLLRAGWMIGVAGVCYKLAVYTGGFFLWGAASPEALASFSAAQRLLVPTADMAWLFVTPLIASMSMAAAHSPGALRAQLEGYAKFLLGMSALVAVAGYFLAPLLLRLLYGEQYAAGPWSSVGVFRWLALGYVFALVTPVLVVGELAHGAANVLMYVGIALLGLNALLNTWAVPARGAEGAAMAFAASEAFAFAVLFARCLARRDARLDAAWVVYLVPAALLGAILALLDGSPVLQFAVACAWAPASLLATTQLPAQKACRASLAAVTAQWGHTGALAPPIPGRAG